MSAAVPFLPMSPALEGMPGAAVNLWVVKTAYAQQKHQMGVSIVMGPPQLDGIFHGKSYFNMDDFGGTPIFRKPPAWGCGRTFFLTTNDKWMREKP